MNKAEKYLSTKYNSIVLGLDLTHLTDNNHEINAISYKET